MPDLIEIAATGATFRLFYEADLSTLPDRIPLLPKPGVYKHPEYGDLTITAERNRNFAANINNATFQKYIPINAEHTKNDPLGALGWFSSAVVNDDGSVDAPVEWAERGKAMLAGKAFRYVSPEWHERWTDKANGVEHQDVVVGLALTTRPFFKDSSLRPLVASDGQLVAPPKEVMGADVTTPDGPTDTSKGNEMEFTEQQFNELNARVETLTQQFADADNARKLAEADAASAKEQAKTFAERIGTLEAERRRDGFMAEVMGKSAANGTRWFGDVDKHVAILESLSDDNRQLYIEQQREVATRMAAVVGRKAVGSDSNADASSALGQMETKARAMAEQKGIPYEQAFSEVMTTDRELARRYVIERRGNVDSTEE